MIISIDIGNTNIECAIFDGNKILGNVRMTTAIPRTSDEFGIFLSEFAHTIDGFSVDKVEGVAIASVVPHIMYGFVNGIRKYFKVDPLIIGPGMKTGINIKTDNPREVGADLIVEAVAAKEFYGYPCIIVDFGTATTYELVKADGSLDSVVICPGIKGSQQSLSSGTAQLPDFEIKKPKTVLGKNTIACLQAGLFYGTLGQTEYIVELMKKEAGLPDAKVIATGGLGATFAQHSNVIDIYDSLLTIKGIKLIYDLNQK